MEGGDFRGEEGERVLVSPGVDDLVLLTGCSLRGSQAATQCSLGFCGVLSGSLQGNGSASSSGPFLSRMSSEAFQVLHL